MIEVEIQGKIYKFAEDLCGKAMHDLGPEPTKEAGSEKMMEYNYKRIVAFSVEPKLSLAALDEMMYLDIMKIIGAVIIPHNVRMKDFLIPLKTKNQ